MLRYVVCSVALAAVAYAISTFLHAGFDRLGFVSGAIIGLAFIGAVIGLSFAWDRYERNHSQQSPPIVPSDPQRLEP